MSEVLPPGLICWSSALKLIGLQAGRAYAVVLVVMFHANVFILPQRLMDGGSAWRGFSMGYAGVELFFVISGFVMFYVHRADLFRPAMTAPFITKRIVRVVPLYWIVLGLLLLSYALLPGRGPAEAGRPDVVLGSFLLVPMEATPVLTVAWTLQHEMLFYAMFAAMIAAGALGRALFAGWVLLTIAAAVTSISLPFPLSFVLSPYNALFAMGMCAAATFGALSQRMATGLLAAGITVFVAVGLGEQLAGLERALADRTLLYGAGATAIVAALAAGVVSPGRWTVLVGDASYSIYLVHMPAMSFAALFVAKLGAPWGLPAIVVLIGVVGVGVAAGVMTHLLIERPLLKHAGSVLRGRRVGATG